MFYRRYDKLLPDGEEATLSVVDIREKANRASGKFGGVAGVLQGVHTLTIEKKKFFLKQIKGQISKRLNRIRYEA